VIQIETETAIPAPPERVWSVLADFASYPAWHPHQEIEGIAELGGKVRIKGRLLGTSEFSSNARWTVLRCERHQLIDFGAGWPSLFRLRQWLEIRPHPQGSLLVQGTGFEGVIPWLVLRMGFRIERLRAYHHAVARCLTDFLSGSRPGPVAENRRQRRLKSKNRKPRRGEAKNPT
jgi:uncharacterized protein YndB with AHSA1/START domain